MRSLSLKDASAIYSGWTIVYWVDKICSILVVGQSVLRATETTTLRGREEITTSETRVSEGSGGPKEYASLCRRRFRPSQGFFLGLMTFATSDEKAGSTTATGKLFLGKTRRFPDVACIRNPREEWHFSLEDGTRNFVWPS